MVLNKYDIPMFSVFALSICLFCLPYVGINFIGTMPIRDLAIVVLAIGGLISGLSANHSIKEGKNLQFNRMQRFAGFFVGGMLLLGGLLKLIAYIVSK